MLLALYVWLLAVASRHPDLPENLATADVQQPEPWPTIRSGLFYLIPIGVLVWCLTVEMLSPGLSAFWGVAAMVFQMLTQRPLMAFCVNNPWLLLFSAVLPKPSPACKPVRATWWELPLLVVLPALSWVLSP